MYDERMDKVEIVYDSKGRIYLVHEDNYTEITQEEVESIRTRFFSMAGPPWLKELLFSDNVHSLSNLRFWQRSERGGTKRLSGTSQAGHEPLEKPSIGASDGVLGGLLGAGA